MEQLQKLATNSSTHGLRNLQFPQTPFQLVFWVCAFVGSLCLLAYNFVKVILFFLGTPVDVAVMSLSQVQSFPAITVCNNNPYKKSMLMQLATLQNLDGLYHKLQNTSDKRSKRGIKEDRRFVGFESINHAVTASHTKRSKRKTGDCTSNPYPVNASPLTVVISYDSTQTMVTNSTCGVTGVAPLIPTVFNLLKPNESCPTTATNWPFPYTMCAYMNNYPKNGWLELQDIETNYTVTSSVAAASVSACEQQCLVSNNCYGFVFKNGNCYFNQEGGKVGLGFCNTFQSPGSTYKTIYGCDYWDIYPLANGAVSLPTWTRCAYWIYGAPVLPGTGVNFTCNSGYKLVGPIYAICNASSYTWSEKPVCITDLPFNITYYDEAELSQYLGIKDVNDFVTLSSAMQDFLSYLLSSLNDSQLAMLTYSKNDLFLSCVYNSKPCKSDDLLLVVDRSMGNCYTFSRDYVAVKPGVHAEEYADWQNVVGMKVMIHEQNASSFVDSTGYNLSPGLDTSLSFIKNTVERVSRTSEPCWKSSKDSDYFNYPTDYSVEGCLRSYVQAKVIANCGCGFYKYRLPQGNSTYCGIKKKSCVDDYLKSADGQNAVSTATDYCKQECNYANFRPAVSIAHQLGSFICDEENTACNQYLTTVLKNSVVTRLYFESLTSWNYLEFQTYEIKNLLSDTGSQMGIWLGMSVISALEIIIMCGSLLKLVFQRS